MSRKTLFLPLAALCAAAWLTGCAQTPGPGLVRGEQIYDTCMPCHGKDGHGNVTLAAPAIAGLPQWYVERQLHNFAGAVRGYDHRDMEGQRMRPMARSLYREGDIASVAQYVATLPGLPPIHTMTALGDTAAGRVAFQNVCITCHQENGGGNESLGAPSFLHQHDSYLATQLYKFKNGLRGTHPDDVYGAQMAAMASTLADSAAVNDVIAYIRTLQK